MGTRDSIHDALIEGTRQELRRLEEPRNRTRYFIFGKVGDEEDHRAYSASFDSVPDRVLREARWNATRDEPSLFRVGDLLIPGTLAVTAEGVRISFSREEIGRMGLDLRAVKRATSVGIEYVMDTRGLTGQLLAFLEAHRESSNPFLKVLTGLSEVCEIRAIARPAAQLDLNQSQRGAIAKALAQQVTFVWGPPGTGKTKTLGGLAASLIAADKRVLLTALSNMALDQLLLAAIGWLGEQASRVSIARLGSTMDDRCRSFGREAFGRAGFAGARAGARWSDHVRHASLVAANFAMLSFPRVTHPGRFEYVIADEVSMANIPALAASSFFARTGFVVGGDPSQLPPIYPEDAEEPNEWFRDNVFVKAGVADPDDPRAAFLDTQYRMHREIGDLVSEMFYGGRLKTGIPDSAPVVRLGPRRVLFVHSPGSVQTLEGTTLDTEDQRRFNSVHAESAAKVAMMAIGSGVNPSDVGIGAPYNAQVVKILGTLRENSRRARVNAEGVKVSTFHSFQGQERRVMIVDITDDNVRPTRLTAKRELVNVALSRAKEHLVIIGNRDYLLDERRFSRDEIALFSKMLAAARAVQWRE